MGLSKRRACQIYQPMHGDMLPVLPAARGELGATSRDLDRAISLRLIARHSAGQ
jgi:hypothetical protein